jgi:hypothetical protein
MAVLYHGRLYVTERSDLTAETAPNPTAMVVTKDAGRRQLLVCDSNCSKFVVPITPKLSEIATSEAKSGGGATTVDTGMIAMLGYHNGLDLNTAGGIQELFTLPASMYCIVTHVILSHASTSLTTAEWSFGWNADGDDVVARSLYSSLTNATVVAVARPFSGAKLGTPADTFRYKCWVAQGAAATVRAAIFGYTYMG